MNGNIYGIKTSFHYRQVFGRKPDESIVLMSASLFSYFAFIVDAASSRPKKKIISGAGAWRRAGVLPCFTFEISISISKVEHLSGRLGHPHQSKK
jgi:hypothetical protein